MKIIPINNNNDLNFNGCVKMYNYNKNKHSCIQTNAKEDKALSLLFDQYVVSLNKPLSEKLSYFDNNLKNFIMEFEKILRGSITLPIKSKTTIYKACSVGEQNYIKIPDLFELKHQ